MILDTVAKRIEVALGGAVTASELHCYAAYADHTLTTFVPRSNDTLTSGGTGVTVVAAPAVNVQRQVKYFNVWNADTAAATVTVRMITATATRILVRVTLQTGEHLQYDPGNGWVVIKSDGSIKSVGPAGATGEVQFNNGGVFGASANFAWDIANNKLKLGDGSASHPSYTFVNSATTGFFRQAADVIGIALAGSERYRVAAASLAFRTDGAVQAASFNDSFEIQAQTAANIVRLLLLQSAALAAAPENTIRKSRGNLATPSAVLNNDDLGLYMVQGYDGAAWANAGFVRFTAAENWGGAAHGTRVGIYRRRTGTTADAEGLRVAESLADTETTILVQVNRAGVITLDRVSIGAVDSGGVGFKVLRVPN